jgi:hypothetical protein
MKSSIIDVPRRHDQADLFGINVYQEALIEYIKLTDTPITIALQGEWGSGKTSMMNQLKYELCENDGAPYFPVWINTWQHSLMKTPSQAIMSILEGCINQIGSLNPDKQKWEESKKVIGTVFKTIAKVGSKVAVSTIGADGDSVDDLFEGNGESSDITKLKNEIAKMIDAALKYAPSKMGFTFYIDDLDRIDPPVAVEILELLKNIFDLEKCVFILAIDYDVVIKGLRSKFGELTDKNEREFRAFFDKIIQLPFSMPVASYNVDTFLVDSLKKIGFCSEEELAKEGVAETLSEIAQLSVGCNPRSLKRLMNTLSLISIINNKLKGNEEMANQNKMLNFALVCMQIAYPFIYNQLTEEPDFKQWNESIAAKLKLRPLTEDEKNNLNAAEEFDDDWEKVLFRMCQKEIHLSNRAFQVSLLMNKIAEIVNDDANLGTIVEATLELSAVTNLKAFDAPKKVLSRQGPRQENTLNGVTYKGKGLYIRAIVEDYVTKHPEITLAELQKVFNVEVSSEVFENGVRIDRRKINIIQNIEDVLSTYKWTKGEGQYGYEFYVKEDLLIKLKDASVAVWSYWPKRYYEPMRDICRKLGYQMQEQ